MLGHSDGEECALVLVLALAKGLIWFHEDSSEIALCVGSNATLSPSFSTKSSISMSSDCMIPGKLTLKLQRENIMLSGGNAEGYEVYFFKQSPEVET